MIGSFRRRLILPLGIIQPAVEFKHRFRIARIEDGDLNCGELIVPFNDLDAADVFFGPGLVVDPDVAIGMEEEEWFFPIGSGFPKSRKEGLEFVFRFAWFNHKRICLAQNDRGPHVAH